MIENKIVQSLRDREFFWTIEFVVSAKHKIDDDIVVIDDFVKELATRPEVAGFSISDRVSSDNDPCPIDVFEHVADHTGTQPLVHWSGKDRSLQDLDATLEQYKKKGVENVLMVTGDKLKSEQPGKRPRYLESVPAIQYAKRIMPELFIAAALNPFKYREEDAMAQYLKLSKKIAAGADCVITQIGFDLVKHEEAMFWMHSKGCRIPAIANVMALSAPRARYIRKNQLAGVTITDSLMELLEADEKYLGKREAETRVMRRLALQIQALKYIDYAGVQLTALHSVQRLQALKVAVNQVQAEISDRLSWDEAWKEVMSYPHRKTPSYAYGAPEKGWYLSDKDPQESSSSLRDSINYSIMEKVHKRLFDKGALSRIMSLVLSGVRRGSIWDRALRKIEKGTKGPLFGCETCGTCRLAATQFICPETCPKGLANGPCGGTTNNLCEFGDRECVHSRKYRVARQHGVLHQLETLLIPAVPDNSRGSSSWPPYLRKEAPVIVDASSLASSGTLGSVENEVRPQRSPEVIKCVDVCR